jgi:hypothetical protein
MDIEIKYVDPNQLIKELEGEPNVKQATTTTATAIVGIPIDADLSKKDATTSDISVFIFSAAVLLTAAAVMFLRSRQRR